jgi:hypothetical protein
VGNSPLSYTDPSGHGLLGIVGSIVSYFYPPVGALLIAVDGYLEGGLQGALFSVASMAAAAGVGEMFGHAVGTFGHELARAAVHGLIQGALGAAQGGKFGAAFLAAGVTSGYGSSGLGQIGNRVTRVISAAVLGGTVSKIGGGKFANGAVTGAFVQAFNHGGRHDEPEIRFEEGTENLEAAYRANASRLSKLIDRLPDSVDSITFRLGDTGGDPMRIGQVGRDGTVLVDPAYASGGAASLPKGITALQIGHEIFHIGQLHSGAINRTSPTSVWNAEVRAYDWIQSNAGRFAGDYAQSVSDYARRNMNRYAACASAGAATCLP